MLSISWRLWKIFENAFHSNSLNNLSLIFQLHKIMPAIKTLKEARDKQNQGKYNLLQLSICIFSSLFYMSFLWYELRESYFPCWTFPLFLWPACFIKHWYYKEKLVAGHHCSLTLINERERFQFFLLPTTEKWWNIFENLPKLFWLKIVIFWVLCKTNYE